MREDRPLSYWIAVARMGFENDFNRLFDALGISRAELAKRVGASPAYVSKVLNGTAGNFQLSTMTKWARALGAIVQIRLIEEGKEVVRVVDYDTARALDDKSSTRDATPTLQEVTIRAASGSNVRSLEEFRVSRGTAAVGSSSKAKTATIELLGGETLEEHYG